MAYVLYFYIHITLSNMGELLNNMKNNDDFFLEQLAYYESNCNAIYIFETILYYLITNKF